jgi:tRNA threonylcarbamoyladenosine biosynthesis protein TsaB
MILLIDTCGAMGGIALVQAVDGVLTVVGEASIVGKTFAAELVPAISAVLQNAQVSLAELDAIAVVHGPGSFTGVRIGVSAAKGLVEASGTPLIAVSRLQVLMRNADIPGKSIAVLDAGRGEFYAGIYEGGTLLREAVMARDAVLSAASEGQAPILVCEARVEAAFQERKPVVLGQPLPRDVAPIAVERWLKGQFDDVVLLDGNYLRRSDAELFATPHEAETGAAHAKSRS